MLMRAKSLLLSIAAAMALTGTAWAGAGDDCCDDIEDLQRQILLLQSQLDELKESLGASDHTVTWSAAPRISSLDDQFSWKTRGRLMVDFASIDGDQDGINPIGGTPFDAGNQGTEFRSARLGIQGTMFSSTHYVLEIEFANDQVPKNIRENAYTAALALAGATPNLVNQLAFIQDLAANDDLSAFSGLAGEDADDDIDINITDAYIAWDLNDTTRLRIGQFKPPTSLEEQTSLAHTTFMERASFTDAFGMERRIGIGLGFGGDNWTVNLGGFGENLHTDIPFEEGWLLAARATFAPIHKEDKVLHLGASVFWRDYSDDFPAAAYYAKPQANLSTFAYVNTGLIPADSDLFWGLELAGVFGPFAIQGEYGQIKVDTPGFATAAPGFVFENDATFTGWYADASWYITGEHRNYSASRGIFGRTQVKNPVNEGGFGAWQIAVRYDTIDLHESGYYIAPAFDLDGGEQESIIAGLNWHLNDYSRIMANYVHADYEDSLSLENSLIFGLAPEDEIDTIEVRAQIEW